MTYPGCSSVGRSFVFRRTVVSGLPSDAECACVRVIALCLPPTHFIARLPPKTDSRDLTPGRRGTALHIGEGELGRIFLGVVQILSIIPKPSLEHLAFDHDPARPSCPTPCSKGLASIARPQPTDGSVATSRRLTSSIRDQFEVRQRVLLVPALP